MEKNEENTASNDTDNNEQSTEDLPILRQRNLLNFIKSSHREHIATNKKNNKEAKTKENKKGDKDN